MATRIAVYRIAVWLLAAFVFSIPAQNGVTIPGVGSLSRLLGLAALGVGMASLVAPGRLRLRAPSLFVILSGVFLLWNVGTFFWSIVPSVTLGRSTTYAQLAALVWLIHQLVRSDRDVDMLFQAFVLGCYVLIGVGSAAFFGTQGGDFRYLGAFNANGFAIVSALAIPMALPLAFRTKVAFLKVLNFAYPFVAIGAVVLAASRGGFLTAIVALLIVPLTLVRLSPVGRTVVFLVIVTTYWAGFALLPTAFPELQQNVDRLAGTGDELTTGTLTGRTTIWASGFQVFLASPVVGVGAGGFNAAVLPILGSGASAHNGFLAVAVTSGAVGLLVFVGLVVVSLVGVLATRARRLEYLVLYATLIVGMMPTNSENDKFVWFILATLAATRPVLVVLERTSSPSGMPGVPRRSSPWVDRVASSTWR